MVTENKQTQLDSQNRNQGSQLTGQQLQETDSNINQISQYHDQLHQQLSEQQSHLDQLDRDTKDLHHQIGGDRQQSQQQLDSAASRDSATNPGHQSQAEQQQEMDYGY